MMVNCMMAADGYMRFVKLMMMMCGCDDELSAYSDRSI
jgi:hypothetical protein